MRWRSVYPKKGDYWSNLYPMKPSSACPGYEVSGEGMTAEGNRIVVQACFTTIDNLCEMPPTYKEVNCPFVVGYEIENNMITSPWMLADQMELMEQRALDSLHKPLTDPKRVLILLTRAARPMRVVYSLY